MCFPLSLTQHRQSPHRHLSDQLSVIATHRKTGTQERQHARLSHFARAHSLSMKKRCSISLPAKWTARVLQKACEMADLGFPHRHVSSKQKRGARRNSPGSSVSTFLCVDGSLQSFTATKSGAKGSPPIGTLQGNKQPDGKARISLKKKN